MNEEYGLWYTTSRYFPFNFMMSCCSHKGCAIAGKVVLLLLTLTEVAAVLAVYNALLGTGGMSFGSTTGSLSIMALAINSAVWMKVGQMHCSGDCANN